MANAEKDKNNVSTILAVLNTNGTTITPIKANPTTHGILISDGSTGSDYGPTNALRDDNFVPTLMAVSSVDGVTPVAIYCDSNGQILIQST